MDPAAGAFQKGFTRTYAIHALLGVEASDADPLLWLADVYGQCARGDNPFYRDGERSRIDFRVRPRRTGLVIGAHDVWSEDGDKLGHLEQRVFSKGAWSLHDAQGQELLRLVDPQSLRMKVLMTLFEGSPSRWALVRGDTLMARIERKRAPDPRGGRRGLRALLLKLFWGAEWEFALKPEADAIDRRLLAALGVVFIQISVVGANAAD